MVVRPFSSAVPKSAREVTINGIQVWRIQGGATWDVPALQVQMLITGRPGEKVAGTLEASPLQRMLTQRFPTPVPTAWRTVAFDGFEAKVPARWPTHRIVTTRNGNTIGIQGLPPGVCSPPVFQVASVYLGANPAISCPAPFETKVPPTDDGLWLQTSTDPAPLSSQVGGVDWNSATEPERLINIGMAQAIVESGSGDSIRVDMDSAGRRIQAVIGLGPDPAVAEAILSSITPIRPH